MQLYKPTKQKGTKRKNDILDAFIRCMRSTGYAKTSLADVAKEAKIFPSLLFYYFEAKEDLLRVCFQRQTDVVIDGLEQIKHYDLDGKINYITELFFSESENVNNFTKTMFEAIGVSVNDEVLGHSKGDMDRTCKRILAELFVGIDEDETVRIGKAEIIYDLLAGTKLNGLFDTAAGYERGRASFKNVMRLFCTLESTRFLMPYITH
jgi:AcrR family transcriptional regulator